MPYDTSSQLDPHREEIITLINMGVKKKVIAVKYGVHVGTLAHWLKKHGLFHLGKPTK